MRRFATTLIFALVAFVSCSNDPASFEVAATLDDASPGDIISLRADGGIVEYINRRSGEIRSFSRRPVEAEPSQALIAKIDVSIEGEQRGLLGHTVIDGRRFAAWTDPDTLDLVVGEVTSGTVDRIVWAGTGTQSKAIGGHLDTRDGLIVLGLGSLTDWAKEKGFGALVSLDPDGNPSQEPVIISAGWNNPFSFAVDNEDIWVADNAPDGSDLPPDERAQERLGWGGRSQPLLANVPLPQRAPSASVRLPDGRFGVCGFLDGEMWAYEIAADDGVIVRAGTIGPCLTGATVLADGSIVTASLDDNGATVLLIRSAE